MTSKYWCDITIYNSPFPDNARTMLLELKENLKNLCKKESKDKEKKIDSEVNPHYVTKLIEKVEGETAPKKYTVIFSHQKKNTKIVGLEAFAVLENTLDAYNLVMAKPLRLCSYLHLICAQACSGRSVMQTAKDHASNLGKRFILLESFPMNYKYYIYQHQAVSISSKSSITLTRSMCHAPKDEALENEFEITFKNINIYPMLIDLKEGCDSSRELYDQFLEKRRCCAPTTKGTPCRNKCIFHKPHCHIHHPRTKRLVIK